MYKIDSPYLLEQLKFVVCPVNFRTRTTFKIMYHRTNYGFNEPLTNMMRLFNIYSSWFDLTDNRDKIKKNILTQLKQ